MAKFVQDGGGIRAGESGYIYVISVKSDRDDRKAHRKIGVSSDVNKRLRELQTGNHKELVVSYSTKTSDMLAAENAAHERLKHCRVHGEWFLCTLAAAIKAITGA